MLRRGDTLAKRQGYYPSSTPCGSGTTCAEACGAGQVECSAEVGRGVCFDPSLAHCCPDSSGYSCDSGYFCSSDGQANTYCCPNGMDLGACAEAYSLTVSLISQTGTVSAPSDSADSDSLLAGVQPSTTSIYISSTVLASISSKVTSLPSPTVHTVPTSNSSYTTGMPPVEFPGAAAKILGPGVAMLAGLASLVGSI
ncbi:hypothetical protein BU23DRAFT_456633 [Bimuria novae-zelandiae CBS 107.79]|uniref:Uncharacterized protein n=1 Tax=Bimuria novae-zelandiae CBS 107.79 TaxID=1447943 RepID=A0A6A5VGR5_9PLEO|nr:hypothetical protein BU23DRAFT_456633 [Bimuria novae-zelandiae CBS 107.79]